LSKSGGSCSYSQIANCTFHIISVLTSGIKKKAAVQEVARREHPQPLQKTRKAGPPVRIRKKAAVEENLKLKVPPLRGIAHYRERSRSGRDDRVRVLPLGNFILRLFARENGNLDES
jgi:hypothetical protein